ncbi:MAG: carboxypeptidase-like regulatory domain-containing protein [Bacteroidales bacterium]|nr:carboxypeptidase-like regulatory domain-containing protein [Bacteroidales bacterium]
MKKLALIILMCFSGISFIYSQTSLSNKFVTIKAKNKSIKFVLKQISSQTGYFFTYSPDVIPENKIITYSAKNASIKSTLDMILADSSLTYKIIEDHIIICKKQQSNFFKKSEGSSKNQIYISGKITDKRTGALVPYSSIGILNTGIGTVSNQNGVFTFKIDKSLKDSTLFISHIGYKTQFITVSGIKKTKYNIQLIEDFISVQEVIIRTGDPVKILKQALKNKQKNYLQKQSILTAFYREGVIRKNRVLNFSEAVIKIYKTPYKASFNSDKISIEKSRKIINAEQTDTLNVKLKNGLYSGLELDIIKNPTDFLQEAEMPNYKYRTTDIVTFGNKLAYVIDFTQKENVETSLYKGQIYIETKSLSIIYAEFEVNLKDGNRKVNFIAKKSRRFKVIPVSATYRVSYKPAGEKYVLSHVRADLVFRIKQKRELFYGKYKTFFETVVLNVDTVNIEKFKREKVASKNLVFIDNGYTYDSDFWGANNFITPEKTISDAIEKIRVKLNFKK